MSELDASFDTDVVVIGSGGIGSAAAYWLSRAGTDVIAVEQFPLGHARGGSEDHSRIIRLSYHEPLYVELAKHAYTAWETVEAESGEPLILRTGGLDIAPPGGAIPLDGYREAMTAAGVPYEELDADEVVRRFPQWRLSDGESAIFQEQTGLVMASRANATHRALAIEHGARFVVATVRSIRERAGEIEVSLSDRSIRCRRLVVAAGAWTNQLVSHLGVQFPLDVSLEHVVYTAASDPSRFHHSRFPVWIWFDEPCFYGFPIFGAPAVKTGWDRCAMLTDPDTRPMEPDGPTVQVIRDFVANRLPGADAGLVEAKNCLYTLTPDRDFVIDKLPGAENVWCAIGAGHAFKFASLIGRLLADLATAGTVDVDLASFSAERAVLREVDPVRTYMV